VLSLRVGSCVPVGVGRVDVEVDKDEEVVDHDDEVVDGDVGKADCCENGGSAMDCEDLFERDPPTAPPMTAPRRMMAAIMRRMKNVRRRKPQILRSDSGGSLGLFGATDPAGKDW